MQRPTFALALLALLCFSLPFFLVSCQNQTVDSVRGIDLLVGHTVPGASSGFGNGYIPPNAWAIGALVFLAGALALVGMRLRDQTRERFSSAFALVAAAVCLVLVWWSARDAQTHQFILSVRIGYGYWLCLFCTLAAAVLAVVDARRPVSRAPNPVE